MADIALEGHTICRQFDCWRKHSSSKLAPFQRRYSSYHTANVSAERNEGTLGHSIARPVQCHCYVRDVLVATKSPCLCPPPTPQPCWLSVLNPINLPSISLSLCFVHVSAHTPLLLLLYSLFFSLILCPSHKSAAATLVLEPGLT